jgi:hypothetical protein
VVAIAAGAGSSFAELADGTVLGWGSAAEGALGGEVPFDAGCECVGPSAKRKG